MYLDAGHAGWLGWPANLQPAATLFADLYKQAGSPQAVRGLATNVANYNALIAARADPKITQSNPVSRYCRSFGEVRTGADRSPCLLPPLWLNYGFKPSQYFRTTASLHI